MVLADVTLVADPKLWHLTPGVRADRFYKVVEAPTMTEGVVFTWGGPGGVTIEAQATPNVPGGSADLKWIDIIEDDNREIEHAVTDSAFNGIRVRASAAGGYFHVLCNGYFVEVDAAGEKIGDVYYDG